MSSKFRFSGCLLGLIFVLSSPARSDWLYFTGGGHAELPTQQHESIVDVSTPWGVKFVLSHNEFRAIVASPTIGEEWHFREVKACQSGVARTMFAEAWWALEHGLTPEAIQMFRAALSSPGGLTHAPLKRVCMMLDRLGATTIEPDLRSTEQLIGQSEWHRLDGKHVILLHQAEPSDADERVDVIDRVITTFYLTLAAQGIELTVPHERLISIWFARHKDYVTTLREIEAIPFASTQGFYHPGHRIVFAFDTRSILDQVQARQEIIKSRTRSPQTLEQLSQTNRSELLLELKWRSIDLGIAAHETVHQLVAASRLASEFNDWPIWLHEGFAAQYEVIRDGRWAGVGRVNDYRLSDWRSITTLPLLCPLLRDAALTHGYQRDSYAKSWALVYYLRKSKPTEFLNFITLLQNSRSTVSLNCMQKIFFKALEKDDQTVETEWRAFLKSQRFPHEEHDPKISASIPRRIF